MRGKLPFLEYLAERVVLFDGGNGTELYRRGVFLNRCYEELNLTRPELVQEVHRAFLAAGAGAVETNTFGATRPRLEPHGLGERVREINREGARIARLAASGQAFVGGAIGPLGIRLEPWGPITFAEAVELFSEQVQGLLEGGVDLFVVETFSDLLEIQAAIGAARQAGDFPVIAMMTVNEEGRTPEGVPPDWLGRKVEGAGAEVVGVNCSVGPAPMLSVIEAMAATCSRPLAAMPNAGIPRSIEGRMHYLTSPPYMARYARRFVEAGARVVGGCCGVTPEHIRAMREALADDTRALIPGPAPATIVEAPAAAPLSPAEKSRLAGLVAGGTFVTLLEVPPPRGADTALVLDQARAAREAGVDALLVPDDPRVTTRMSPLAVGALLAARHADEHTPEPVLQYACRDRRLLGMQSDLLGAHALGIRNLVLVTGRAPRPGESSWAGPPFEVDAIGLTNEAFRLNRGLDVGGNPLGTPTAFFHGASATTGAYNREEEIHRLEWKVDAGAEFLVLGPVFDPSQLVEFLARIAGIRVPVIVEIRPPAAHREAEYLRHEVPGVEVPESILERLAGASAEEAKSHGLAIARDLLEGVFPLVEGVLFSGSLAKDPLAPACLAPYAGRGVAERRSFPGRPGMKKA